MDPIVESRECADRHFGRWAIVPEVLERAVGLYVEGKLPMEGPGCAPAGLRRGRPGAYKDAGDLDEDDGPRRSFAVEDGVGVIDLVGPMMKGWSKFGGTSTVAARVAVREAMRAGDVHGVILRIDSPGGHVAGTQELFDDVRALARKKPVHAYIEDLGASAAYWVASAAGKISANRMAEVGSIGVFGILEDRSKMYEKRGIVVHRVASGDLKGQGVDGLEVGPEVLEEAQRLVDAMAGSFLADVRGQRGVISDESWGQISRGGIFTAAEAKELGLIDGIASFDAVFEEMRTEARKARLRRGLLRAG